MYFEEVLPALREGKIKREGEQQYYFITCSGRLRTDKDPFPPIYYEDFIADDWEIVGDKPKKIEWIDLSLGDKYMKIHNKINEIIEVINQLKAGEK